MNATFKLGAMIDEDPLTQRLFPAFDVACPKCGVRPLRPFMRGQVYRSFRLGFGGFADALDIVRHWIRRERRPTSCVICWECKEIVGYE